MENTVLLLKNQQPNDKYISEGKLHGFNVSCLPLFQFEYENIDSIGEILQRMIGQASSSSFFGIIFTSPRAIKAFQMAMDSDTNLLSIIITKNIILYCLGESSSNKLIKCFEGDSQCPIIKGRESNNAKELAHFILDDLKCNNTNDSGETLQDHLKEKQLLYLCGATRRDELPTILSSQKGLLLKLNELIVYKSVPIPNVNFPKYDNLPKWMVFFSPNGVDIIVNLLLGKDNVKCNGEKEEERNSVKNDNNNNNIFSKMKIVAIGQTTKKRLEMHNIIVNKCPSKPNASSLFLELVGGEGKMTKK